MTTREDFEKWADRIGYRDIEAGAVTSEQGFIWGSIHCNDFPKIFNAMLSAAPTPPEIEPIYLIMDGYVSGWQRVSKAVYDKTPVEDRWLLYTPPPSPVDDRSGKRVLLKDQPIPLILFCPACGTQHIDRPEGADWLNPPHKSHLCHNCGHIWRPADVPTEGVEGIYTRGERDSSPVKPADDELRKAAEVFYNEYIAYGGVSRKAETNLRAALNKP